ncbi:DUF748 domain-containing protein [Sansalvadorimonas verongulae]|uniref:DUF748 domain-containing protein n=1 Tax=Sansalvadorimonas verongulae TaxID=2172824 RepID=UPI0012BCD10D|nr:DUF748 domain-containing protein [Sansalvadorimonas verongulae]MTI13339.1 DUF748 domain-containing protein [Sansalvadorimonas verongulae]
MVRKTLSLLCKTLLTYSIVGFLILPAAIHFTAYKLAPNYLTVPLQIGGVTFNPFTLRLDLQAIQLGSDTTSPVAGFHNLTVDLSWSSIRQKALVLDDINLVEPIVRAELRADGTINFASLLKPSAETAPPSKDEDSGGEPIPVAVHHLGIQKGAVSFIDFANTEAGEPFRLTLNPINLEAEQLTWPNSHGDLSLNMRLNNSGDLNVSNQIRDGLDTQTQIILHDISLTDIQPYLTPYLYSVIESGTLSGTAHLGWSPEKQLSANSDITLNKLKVTDSRNGTLVASWNNLTTNGLSFSQRENKLAIKELTLNKPATRVVLDQHLSINLAGLVKVPDNAAKPEEDVAPTSETAATPMEIAIQKFSIIGGALDFSDKSFKPGFAAPITDLNGEVEGFNSRSSQATSITLLGTVDTYSPVNITARLTPVKPLKNTDLSLSFKDIELTTLTPYSGRFAGYSIRKGRMDIALDYGIQNGQLNAENHITLRDLTLGDKVAGESATSLPLKLAIALLKDRHGRIRVDLPVTGDLDNPQFQLGSVIRMAVVNFITNIVAAPFDMLASLVSGDAGKMSAFALQPGSNQLTTHQQATIQSLAQALNERPQLDIEIEPTASTVSDAPILIQQQLQQTVNSRYHQYLKKQGSKQKESQPIPDSVMVQLLAELATEKGLKVPDQTIPALTEALVQSWPMPELALRKLAISRAHSIKQAIIQKGVEPSRVYVLGVELKQSVSGENVFLHLQGR